MLGRFTVRKAGDGSDRFGIWDGSVNGWRASDLTEAQAHAMATDLDVQYDAHGPRPAEAVRRVEPAQRVQRAQWHGGGVLDVWIREKGEWLGRVRDADGQISWVPGPDLRPEEGPPAR
jgi:hypothetical protein